MPQIKKSSLPRNLKDFRALARRMIAGGTAFRRQKMGICWTGVDERQAWGSDHERP
jgi:hypothetical protein